jgi:methylated-DNA-[protein]-cysteine S-methyltransferase
MVTGMQTVTAEHTVLSTRLGDLTIVRDDDHLIGLYFPHHWYGPDPVTFGRRSDQGFEDVARQLAEYLAGTRTDFDLPTEARGNRFQRRVWELIAQIPYGHTTSYGDLARWLGGEATAQEVGAAVSRNPLCILIPCHRVIGSTGKLTGYAGGLKRKQGLLELERATVLPGRSASCPAGGLITDQPGLAIRLPAVTRSLRWSERDFQRLPAAEQRLQ